MRSHTTLYRMWNVCFVANARVEVHFAKACKAMRIVFLYWLAIIEPKMKHCLTCSHPRPIVSFLCAGLLLLVQKAQYRKNTLIEALEN